MLEHIDPVILARIQFALTISFQIISQAFTIGLGISLWPWLVPV
jgi:cytochrome bd-type quinol oxidase subunit 1